jgi:bifunctional aspartokinase / homoserine dehydrogenase 1
LADTVINTETFVEPQVVKSVASTDDISLLQIHGPGVGLKPGILARITTLLTRSGINIKSVITSQISIQLLLEAKSGAPAFQLIEQAAFPSVREIKLVDEVSLLGVIGHGLGLNSRLPATILGALANEEIQVVLSGSGASELATYLVVKSSEKAKSVQSIYNAFFNGTINSYNM